MQSLPNVLLTVTAVNECLDSCPNSFILELAKVSRSIKCSRLPSRIIKDFYKHII